MREGVQQHPGTAGIVAPVRGAEMGIGGNKNSRGLRVDGDRLGILCLGFAAAFAPHYEGFGS